MEWRCTDAGTRCLFGRRLFLSHHPHNKIFIWVPTRRRWRCCSELICRKVYSVPRSKREPTLTRCLLKVLSGFENDRKRVPGRAGNRFLKDFFHVIHGKAVDRIHKTGVIAELCKAMVLRLIQLRIWRFTPVTLSNPAFGIFYRGNGPRWPLLFAPQNSPALGLNCAYCMGIMAAGPLFLNRPALLLHRS
jgi:hypothetical protein